MAKAIRHGLSPLAGLIFVVYQRYQSKHVSLRRRSPFNSRESARNDGSAKLLSSGLLVVLASQLCLWSLFASLGKFLENLHLGKQDEVKDEERTLGI